MASRESAGILLYRRRQSGIEVLIAHPGGPFWRNKDAGAWSLPKGEVDGAEDRLEAAIREFEEETGHTIAAADAQSLGAVRLKSGKVIHAWAAEGDFDPGALNSNLFSIEWPPRSGTYQQFPEIDAVAWVAPDEAAEMLNPAQVQFVARLIELLGLEG